MCAGGQRAVAAVFHAPTARCPPLPGPRVHSTKRAFTLVEVCLALGILVLLVGALYAMVDATLSATAELEIRENRSQQISGFVELCRRTFHSLPPGSTFQTRTVQQGGDYAPELVFRNSNGLFAWGETGSKLMSNILGVRPQDGGLASLSLLQDTDDQIGSYITGGSTAQPWLALLTDLRKVEWRFFDSRTNTWMKEWTETAFRPALVELTLTAEDSPERYVFWVPPVGQQQQVAP